MLISIKICNPYTAQSDLNNKKIVYQIIKTRCPKKKCLHIEVFYLNTIRQFFQFVEQQDQLEVCLVCSKLLTGIPMPAGISKFKVVFK